MTANSASVTAEVRVLRRRRRLTAQSLPLPEPDPEELPLQLSPWESLEPDELSQLSPFGSSELWLEPSHPSPSSCSGEVLPDPSQPSSLVVESEVSEWSQESDEALSGSGPGWGSVEPEQEPPLLTST
jgi:hypothetical protein